MSPAVASKTLTLPTPLKDRIAGMTKNVRRNTLIIRC